MDWLAWALVALFMFGTWGVLARGILNALDWRLLATFSILGYAMPIAALWLIAPPETDGVTWLSAAKALSVGLLTQTGLLMFYKSLDLGGKASVVVPITALYPAVTLLGALLLLDESISVQQFFGAILAVIAVVALSRG